MLSDGRQQEIRRVLFAGHRGPDRSMTTRQYPPAMVIVSACESAKLCTYPTALSTIRLL
jgi:hypothetical protein